MDLYSLLDTIVKIALGAAISGAITYHLAKLSHESELKKIGAVRRMESLEKASERAEQFFFGWRQLSSLLGGIFKGRKASGSEFSDAQWEQINARDKILLEAREHLHHVIARLRLLGGSAAADCLVEIYRVVGEFRDPIILHRTTPNVEHFEVARAKVNELAETFHQEMRSLYAEI